MSNSTCAPSDPHITTYAGLAFSGISFVFSAILVLLKKDGLFDRVFPRQVPRRPTLQKLNAVHNRLNDIIIQLTNLTPQNSSENNDERLHSSTGVRSDRNGDSDEDVQRLRVCEEGGACVEIQLPPSTVLEKPRRVSDSSGTRTEPRRWHGQTQLVCDDDNGRHQAAGRSSSRSGSSPRHDQPRERKALRSSNASERSSSNQPRSSAPAQEGIQTSHRL